VFGLFKSWGISLTPEEAHKRHRDGAIHLVDVREVNEWTQARVPGAVLLPLSTMTEGRLKELPRGRKIVFYCMAGSRSSRAMSLCRRLGLPHDHHVAGGISAWARAGLPIER
jgi:rhodanese-related sulfurtransferase